MRPYYEFASRGEIVSHIHVALGPLRAWVSASGVMRPAQDGTAKVMLDFDDFWVAGDTPQPRDAPTGGAASRADRLVAALGRLLFFGGLAGFPVDHVDLVGGIVAFASPRSTRASSRTESPTGRGHSPFLSATTEPIKSAVKRLLTRLDSVPAATALCYPSRARVKSAKVAPTPYA